METLMTMNYGYSDYIFGRDEQLAGQKMKIMLPKVFSDSMFPFSGLVDAMFTFVCLKVPLTQHRRKFLLRHDRSCLWRDGCGYLRGAVERRRSGVLDVYP